VGGGTIFGVPATRFAIVLTHNRPALLARCLAAIVPQTDLTLVVDNASDPPAVTPDGLDNVLVVRDEEQPPNLARLWNRGLDALTMWRPPGLDTWDVAVLCDDAVVHPGWFDAVASTMRGCGAAAGSTHSIQPVAAPLLKTAPDSDLFNRMCGWAFVLRGETNLRADESMHWWWQDTSMDFDARTKGGMVIAPGPVVLNERPNDFTYSVPGLAEQAGRDREAFQARWGFVPW
jgi:glycosyltransferase involved in cell wall biosynthesis